MTDRKPSRLDDPLVQNIALALFTAYPVFVLTMGGLLTARFAALTGHFPDSSLFAAPSFRNALALCERDRGFGMCAAIFRFRDGDFFVCGWVGFMVWLLFLLTVSLSLKQKRFAQQLTALVAAYFLLGNLLWLFTPLAGYYLRGHG